MKKEFSLDEFQQQAVEATNNVLLIAGAGAGKTFTITQKINYLICVFTLRCCPHRDIFYDSASLRQEKQSNKFSMTVFVCST